MEITKSDFHRDPRQACSLCTASLTYSSYRIAKSCQQAAARLCPAFCGYYPKPHCGLATKPCRLPSRASASYFSFVFEKANYRTVDGFLAAVARSGASVFKMREVFRHKSMQMLAD